MDIEARMHEVEREIVSRRPEHSVDLALDRMAELVGLLGDPQRACPVIHITGTNGKTSTARMTDALLRGRGLRTGRFTSPHLVSIRERIVVDGAPVSAERFVEAYDEILPYVRLVDEHHPAAMSFFEVLTGMAFAIFADTPVDVVVLEVGVGGRLDCTNVADGVVAVITPISIDHTRLLGDTVEEIAAEKAGIIKPGATAVLAQQPLAAAEVLLRHSVEVGATVAREGVEFGVLSHEQAVGGQQLALRGLRGTYEDIFLPLFGSYQAGNAACALAAVEAFAGVSDENIYGAAGLDADLVREAFAKVTSPGRLEVMRRSPTIVIDAAHNPAGMAATVAGIEESFNFDHHHRRLRGQRGQGRGRDARRTRAAARRDRGDPQLLRAVIGPRRDRRAGRRDLRRGPGAVRSPPRRRDRGRGRAGRRGRRGNRPRRRRGADHRVRHHRRRCPQAARPVRRRAAARGAGQPALPPLVHRGRTVMSGLDIPVEGKSIRQLCGIVLVFEAIVIGLAIPVAIVLEHTNHGLAAGIGGALAVSAILISGVVGRPRMGWALLAGTILQLLVIAYGVVVPAMYALGAIFAALWVTGIWLARRVTPRPGPS